MQLGLFEKVEYNGNYFVYTEKPLPFAPSEKFKDNIGVIVNNDTINSKFYVAAIEDVVGMQQQDYLNALNDYKDWLVQYTDFTVVNEDISNLKIILSNTTSSILLSVGPSPWGRKECQVEITLQ